MPSYLRRRFLGKAGQMPNDPLADLRRASLRLDQAEREHNRLLRQGRADGVSLVDLADAGGVSVGQVQRRTIASTIVSLGYEGRTAEELLIALLSCGVDCLVDVRQNAISRKAGLSKRSLAARCEQSGIAYEHEPTLGNPRDNRDGSGRVAQKAWRATRSTFSMSDWMRSIVWRATSTIESLAFSASKLTPALVTARS